MNTFIQMTTIFSICMIICWKYINCTTIIANKYLNLDSFFATVFDLFSAPGALKIDIWGWGAINRKYFNILYALCDNWIASCSDSNQIAQELYGENPESRQGYFPNLKLAHVIADAMRRANSM